MPSTAEELCNVALARVGQKRDLLDDFAADTTEAAELCRALYPVARDAILASAPWSFATKRATLADLDDPRSGWAYTYALPTDCLVARELYAGSRNPTADERIVFAIEYDATTAKRVLVTDQEDAELVYTAALEAVPLFPPLAQEAIAWRLASDLALALTVKPQVGLAMAQGAARALATAIAADFREGREDLQPDSEFIRER